MNPIRITVEGPDDILAAPAGSWGGAGALLRVERSATGGGVGFAEVGTRAILAGTTIYLYYDVAGITGSWYRVRYSDAAAANFSDYGGEFQGGIDAGYCSLYNVKQRLGISATDTTDDENLQEFIRQVTGWIDSVTGREFLPDPPTGTKTYTFDGRDALEGGKLLLIPRGVRSVTGIQISVITGDTLVSVPAGNWFLGPPASERDTGWPATEIWMTDIPSAGNNVPIFYRGFQNIAVTGAFGWASVPADIEDVALTTVVRSWEARRSGQGDVVGTDELGRPLVSRMLSGRDRDTLSRYTNRRVFIV